MPHARHPTILLLPLLFLTPLISAQGCMTSKGVTCADIYFYQEEDCNGDSGFMCTAIPDNQCCGTDAATWDSCSNDILQTQVGGAPKGSDLTNLCAVEVARNGYCASTSLNNIVGCYYTYDTSGKRDVADPVLEKREQCVEPSHAWKKVDGKVYMLRRDRPEFETYSNMTNSAEKTAFIMKNADEVREA